MAAGRGSRLRRGNGKTAFNRLREAGDILRKAGQRQSRALFRVVPAQGRPF